MNHGDKKMIRHDRNLGRRRLTVAAMVVLIVAGGGRAFAQAPPDYRINKEFLKGFGRDFAVVVTSPLHWHHADLGRFALVSGVTLTAVAFDERINDWVQVNRTDYSADVSSVSRKFGDGAYLLGFSAALYAAGEIWHSRGMRRTALLSAESLATASVIVWVTKSVVGRARPRTGHDYLEFRPFTINYDYNSFPSGHVAAAFAVATTLAEQTRGVAVDILAYSMATLVGLSRIHDSQHWASSVVAAGALGYFVAKKIGGRHRSTEPSKTLDMGFALGHDRLALTLTYVF